VLVLLSATQGYGERCSAPSDTAVAQLLQQNVWPFRSTFVLRSTICDSQCAHTGTPGWMVVAPAAIATQLRQQYVFPADCCMVL
jgi:hypothetical protein